LHRDVKLYFESDLPCEKYVCAPEKGHGRIEKREYFLVSNIDWLAQKSNWANLRAIGAIRTNKANIFFKQDKN